MTLTEFLQQLVSNPPLIITVILVLGVVMVNGWTDAPNAIATCVSTRAMKPKPAVIMAAVFNFLGVFIMSMFYKQVAETIYNMVDFGKDTHYALIALCASLFAIVVWATAAWAFGIPTSESHALIAGVTGAAIALQGGHGINGSQWIKVIYGLLLSTFLGFILGYILTKLIEFLFKHVDKRKANSTFQKAQVGAGAAMAFMHGAQDGQKFMGVFLLGAFLAKGSNVTNFSIPIWLMVLCSAVMGLGTSIGGYKIIKTVGMDMVKLKTYEGFAADLTAVISIFLATVYGIPVSTTHTKTTAIMGVGAAKKLSNVNWGVAKEMAAAWILTFPGCGLLAYLMSFLFLKIF
jgi:PiT family inorganic phosphate transporter